MDGPLSVGYRILHTMTKIIRIYAPLNNPFWNLLWQLSLQSEWHCKFYTSRIYLVILFSDSISIINFKKGRLGMNLNPEWFN